VQLKIFDAQPLRTHVPPYTWVQILCLWVSCLPWISSSSSPHQNVWLHYDWIIESTIGHGQWFRRPRMYTGMQDNFSSAIYIQFKLTNKTAKNEQECGKYHLFRSRGLYFPVSLKSIKFHPNLGSIQRNMSMIRLKTVIHHDCNMFAEFHFVGLIR